MAELSVIQEALRLVWRHSNDYFFTHNSNSMKNVFDCDSISGNRFATINAPATWAVLPWRLQNFVAILNQNLDESNLSLPSNLNKDGRATVKCTRPN